MASPLPQGCRRRAEQAIANEDHPTSTANYIRTAASRLRLAGGEQHIRSIAYETARPTLLRLPSPPCVRAAGGGWRKRARPQAGAGGAGQAAAKRHQTAPGSNWRPSAQAAQVPTPAAKAALGTSSAAAGAPMSGAYPVQLSGLMQLHTEHQHQLGLAGPSTSTPAAAPPGQLHDGVRPVPLKQVFLCLLLWSMLLCRSACTCCPVCVCQRPPPARLLTSDDALRPSTGPVQLLLFPL